MQSIPPIQWKVEQPLLHYQILSNMDSKYIITLEILMRWFQSKEQLIGSKDIEAITEPVLKKIGGLGQLIQEQALLVWFGNLME